MPTTSLHPVIDAQGPEWAVHCDGPWMDPPAGIDGMRRGALGMGADASVYKTVLQVLDLGTDAPIELPRRTARLRRMG